MITTSMLYCLLLVLPADLQSIITDLGSDRYTIRKKAKASAMALSPEKKRQIIKELIKSSDPELTETAKELKKRLPAALDHEQILIFLLKGKYNEVKKALELNPKTFEKSHVANMNIVDIAKTLRRKQFIDLFEKAGIKGNGIKMKAIDVLVVESDTWQSLASDFNTKAELIMLLNRDKQLTPGIVVHVPISN